MKKTIVHITILGLIFAISSCANDNEADLIDHIPVLQLVTYNDNIKSIIDDNCIICHSNPPVNGAPNSFMDYNSVKNSINSIINRISKQQGEAGLMPLGGTRLPQNLIDEVIQWQTDGLLEQ